VGDLARLIEEGAKFDHRKPVSEGGEKAIAALVAGHGTEEP